VVYDCIFIINIITITGIIVGVKGVNTFFPIFPSVTARGLVGFFKDNNNAVRKEKSRFKKKKKGNYRWQLR
jgi:hypothetical protein